MVKVTGVCSPIRSCNLLAQGDHASIDGLSYPGFRIQMRTGAGMAFSGASQVSLGITHPGVHHAWQILLNKLFDFIQGIGSDWWWIL